MPKLTRLVLAATSVVSVALPMVALSAPAAQAQMLSVRADDLNLSTPDGQKQLDRRAESVARALCRGTYMPDVNCVPGLKAKLVEKATADGSVTIDKSGGTATFVKKP